MDSRHDRLAARFRPLFHDLRPLLGNQAIREVLLAAHGLKVSRLCVDDRRALELVSTLERAGLWVDLHSRKQLFSPDKGKGGWISGYGLEVPVEFPLDGYLHLYVGTDPERVLAAKKAEHANRFSDFGNLLGYPPCCIEFYRKHLSEAESEQGDLLLPLLRESAERSLSHPPVFPLWTNIAAQYFDYGLISFYPCSFYCKNAIAFARTTLDILRRYDENLASAYIETAGWPVLYTEYEGVFLFRGAKIKRDVLYYDKNRIEYSLEGVVISLLTQADRIHVRSLQCLELRDGKKRIACLDGRKLGLMLFEADETGNE